MYWLVGESLHFSYADLKERIADKGFSVKRGDVFFEISGTIEAYRFEDARSV